MEKSLQVTVTNPDDLNTLQGELVTQNYNLEILGLKNPADFRKFSKSLMMLDRILKETNYNVDNGLNKKLNKGTYEGDADDLKREIDGKEPAFIKNTGFNKEKTDNYNENDTNKLFTQKGANSLHADLKNNIDINASNINKCLKYDIKNDNIKYPINIADMVNPKYQLGANTGAYNWGWYSEYGAIKSTGLMGGTDPSGASEHLNYSWYIANNLEYDLKSMTFKRRRLDALAHILITGDHERGMSLYRVNGEETNLRGNNAVKSFYIDSGNLEGFIGGHKILTAGNIHQIFCPYQIGDILATSNSRNPNTTWTSTSWERIANGRALVGVDEGQPEFNTVMKQGGEKTHTLSINEMPSHNHGYTGVVWDDHISFGDETEKGGLNQFKASDSTGGGQAHNNLQPYLTVYYWRRIG